MREREFNGDVAPVTRQTTRLRLRIPEPADIHFLTELFSRPELVAHRPVPRPDSPEESAERLARDIKHWKENGFGRWAVETADALIGFGGVTISRDFDSSIFLSSAAQKLGAGLCHRTGQRNSGPCL